MSKGPLKSIDEILLDSLKIYSDEPKPDSNLFNSESFSEILSEFILDKDLPTPYVIGLDGEWGSGKTTLLKKTHKKINTKNLDNTYLVWFDAWKYEKYDPVLSLYQHILDNIEEKNGSIKSDLKKILLEAGLLASSMLSKQFLGIDLDQVRERYESILSDTKTIKDKLEENIGSDGKLIVFIDDLDRCENENILSILSNIKEVLNSDKTIFILGIDMKKISVAWDIKHQGHGTAILEGKEHVDKLFQLKLKIPTKSIDDLMKYVEDLVKNLPEKERGLISMSVNQNPRKIKIILNTLYFLVKELQLAKSNSNLIPQLLTITLLSVMYNEIFQIIKKNPTSFYDAMLVCLMCLDFKELKDNMDTIPKIHANKNSVDLHRGRINSTNISKSGIEILEHIKNNEDIFSFVINIATYLSMDVSSDGSALVGDTELFTEVVTTTPFLS